ncbi:hypothetical protein [Parerythrobacter jejuensis]|uniref:Uncharacterized protein n=1 Tax=Parerythrobacter jejuensis TaxID=795812 RepID=A0A845ALP9_9SPHN|nr:hypothetical protein [Parerythrobacter jejuensis]MXP31190.1 hypothetical protein [Parerythrobacter jejuensis]MXP33950.1 hypothetical protein [Parerythrobacter jejuensis]
MMQPGVSLTILRMLGAGLALSLMIGEAIRTWGTGRPFPFWFDDYWTGGLLLAGALLMARPTPFRSHVFVVGWAACLGMLFGSFFGKIYDPASANSGNIDLGFLTILIGMAFATAIIGLVWSLWEVSRA